MTVLDRVDARLVDLPYSIRGMSAVDDNGDPMIYLNARHTAEQHLRTYDHELHHLQGDDFYNSLSIWEVETAAGTPSPDPVPKAEEDTLLPEDLAVVARMRAWLWWGIRPDDAIWADFSRAYRTELIKAHQVGRWANRRRKPNPPHLSKLIRRLYAESFTADEGRNK